jgi:PIN domain
MDYMLVTPLPGTSREHLLKTLRDMHTAVSNLYTGGSGPAHDRLTAYVEWATTAMQHLGNQISSADLDRLVLTPGYGRLLSAVGRLTGLDVATQRVLNGMVSLELQQRTEAFEAACKTLEKQIQGWSGQGVFVLPDTTIYIESPAKLEDLDFVPLVDPGWPDTPILVLVPIVVVDELDGLKNKASKPHAKWRAGYTLAHLEKVFAKSTGPATLRAANPDGSRGYIRMEMVLDPPGHVRLPINDDEIIDRALAIQPLVGRPVTLLTYDTGQSMRARAAGLRVKKLTMPIGDEPHRAERKPIVSQ